MKDPRNNNKKKRGPSSYVSSYFLIFVLLMFLGDCNAMSIIFVISVEGNT